MKEVCAIVEFIQGARQKLPSYLTYSTVAEFPSGSREWSVVVHFDWPIVDRQLARLSFLSSQAPEDWLEPGIKLQLFEGDKPVANVEIVEPKKIVSTAPGEWVLADKTWAIRAVRGGTYDAIESRSGYTERFNSFEDAAYAATRERLPPVGPVRHPYTSYDSFFDVIIDGPAGIFGEDNMSLKNGLAAHDLVEQRAAADAVHVTMCCTACGVPLDVCVDWAEIACLAHGSDPASVVSAHVNHWRYVSHERGWLAQDVYHGCEHLRGVGGCPIQVYVTEPEAREHIAHGLRERWTFFAGPGSSYEAIQKKLA